MPSPMPDPSTPQFIPWLQQQDPDTQQQIVRVLGMDQASQNPYSTSGSFAPQITDFSYDLPSMLGGIQPSTNSKGTPNPYNVESQAKYLNYAQDLTGSAGLGNNMLSWMSGGQATDPSAWTPIKSGKGSPLQFENLSVISAMAQGTGDDVQTFMAKRLMEGKTPAAAMAELKATVRSGQASDGLLSSMTSNYDTNAVPGDTAPDIKSDAGFAKMYDVKSMLGDANDMYKGVVKDKALMSSAYQDPKTGQYYSGYDESPTEQMQAADKLGLAYPTTKYDDPAVQDQYVQQMFGYQPGQAAAMDADRAARIDALKQTAYDTHDKSRQAGIDADTLVKAWNDNFTAPSQPVVGPGDPDAIRPLSSLFGAGATAPQGVRPPTPRPTPDTQGPYVGMAPSYSDGSVVGQAPLIQPRDRRAYSGLPLDPNITAEMITSGQMPDPFLPVQTPIASGTVTTGGLQGRATLGPKTNAAGTKTQTTSREPQIMIGPDGMPRLATDEAKAAAFTPTSPPTKMGAGLSGTLNLGPKVAYKQLTPADLDTARKVRANAADAAADAEAAYGRSLALSPDDLERAKLRVAMNTLGRQGRTPLNDQLAARSQTLRNLIGQ